MAIWDRVKDGVRRRLAGAPAKPSAPSDSTDDNDAVVRAAREPLAAADDDLPVVARMVVEIRSDGSRTVARGAMEDIATGEKMGIEARGSTPLALAGALARSMMTTPLLAGGLVRDVLGQRLGSRSRRTASSSEGRGHDE